jgi:hypothetical protein
MSDYLLGSAVTTMIWVVLGLCFPKDCKADIIVVDPTSGIKQIIIVPPPPPTWS